MFKTHTLPVSLSLAYTHTLLCILSKRKKIGKSIQSNLVKTNSTGPSIFVRCNCEFGERVKSAKTKNRQIAETKTDKYKNHFLNPVEIENGKVRVIVEKNGKSVK